jgi:rubrerythrin
MPQPIRTLEEFYAHALAMEHEAAERYAEFEAWFRDRGEEMLAGLCRNLSQAENEHFRQLERGARGLTLPVIPAGEMRWLDAGSPESPAHELFYRVAEPRHLLQVALAAECRAAAFFEWVVRTSPSPEVRERAREIAEEEALHVRWMRDALEYHPSWRIDWEGLLGGGTGPGARVGPESVDPDQKPRRPRP